MGIFVNNPLFVSVRDNKPLKLQGGKEAQLSDVVIRFCVALFSRDSQGNGFPVTQEDADHATNVLEQIRLCSIPQFVIEPKDFEWLQGALKKYALMILGLDSSRTIRMVVSCPPELAETNLPQR